MIKKGRIRWEGHVAPMGDRKVAYQVLVGKPERKNSLRMPRRIWEDNIKINHKQVGKLDDHWMYLAQDMENWRAVGDEYSDSIKCGEFI
jgi:hypothetical protein